MAPISLFPGIAPVSAVNALLTEHHYLGPTKTALFCWQDRHGCMVFARPRSRRLPNGWLELVRWCIVDGSGSQQWAGFTEWARRNRPETTIVSYSDPSRGHTGALYRACNWLWAPTWLRLRPPPTANGCWGSDKVQTTKDRWIFPLRPDAERAGLLTLNDEALLRKIPWAEYREPAWNRLRFNPATGGGDYRRWVEQSVRPAA